jgi:hypothetical protein
MSFPFEDLSRNYKKYHFDTVISWFNILIDVIRNLVCVN